MITVPASNSAELLILCQKVHGVVYAGKSTELWRQTVWIPLTA